MIDLLIAVGASVLFVLACGALLSWLLSIYDGNEDL